MKYSGANSRSPTGMRQGNYNNDLLDSTRMSKKENGTGNGKSERPRNVMERMICMAIRSSTEKKDKDLFQEMWSQRPQGSKMKRETNNFPYRSCIHTQGTY